MTALFAVIRTVILTSVLTASPEKPIETYPEVTNSVIDRTFAITNPTVMTLNGRTQIWAEYLENIGDWGVRGYGIGIEGTNIPGSTPIDADPHSIPLQLLVQLGSVGLIIWTVMVILFLRSALKCCAGKPAIFMWISLAPLALTTSTADLAVLWITFTFAGMCVTDQRIDGTKDPLAIGVDLVF